MLRRAFGAASAVALVSAVGASATSCGGGQTNPRLFSSDWEDDGGATIEAVRLRLGGAKPPRGADVAVGVAGNADKIVGLPLSGGKRWTFAHALDARPMIAGSVVVATGGREVFALDALTGQKLWTRETGGLELRGVGDDGAVTAMTFSKASGAGSVLLAVTRDGRSVRQIETDKQLGAPAVVQGLAFVPWGSQYISVIDLASGDEAARVTLREKTSHAWTVAGGLYFGEVGIFRFDHGIRMASKGQATHIGIPPRELPGTPTLMFSGTTGTRPLANAQDKIRLYARPSGDSGALGFDASRFYATYFKLVIGFESNKGQLAWVHTHSSSVLGGAAGSGSLVLCDEQGKLTELDATSGVVLGEQDLGEAVKSCVVQVDAFQPPKNAVASERLVDQLEKAVTLPDADLSTGQRLLLRELATANDDNATRVLVTLASDPRTAPDLRADARVALANRRNGDRYMIEALGKRYDYLKDVLLTPPVAPMAQALAAMNATDAAPLLAKHLLDPADTDEDVKQSAAALLVLGGPRELPPLKQFFGMYRATADGPDVAAAVVSVGQTLLKLGGVEGRAMIDLALKDPMTMEFVKERLDALVQAADAEKAPSNGDKGAASEAKPATKDGDKKPSK